MTRLIERAAAVAAIGVNAVVDSSDLAEDLRRPVTLYLLVMGCNLPGATVAAIAGCSKQNVSKHLRRIESARSDMKFDQALERLETKLFGGW